MSAALCDPWRLADGQLVVVRGATREDIAAVHAFMGQLSLQSRYRRFLYAARELTPPMQRQFTRSNPMVEMSLLAMLIGPDGSEYLIGAAQYAVTRWPECDFAVVVADAWQRRGIGRRLIRDLMGVAGAAGLQSMQGDTLVENEAMRRLLRQMGFALQAHPDGALLRRAVKSLDVPREADCPVLEQVAQLARRLRPLASTTGVARV